MKTEEASSPEILVCSVRQCFKRRQSNDKPTKRSVSSEIELSLPNKQVQ